MYFLTLRFFIRPRPSKVVGVPVVVEDHILINYGLHSVLRVFVRINCACSPLWFAFGFGSIFN
jgi:hypothetical protein